MKSKEEVENESQSAFCGIHFGEFGRTAGFLLIGLTATISACISKLLHGLWGAGTFIYPSTLSNG